MEDEIDIGLADPAVTAGVTATGGPALQRKGVPPVFGSLKRPLPEPPSSTLRSLRPGEGAGELPCVVIEDGPADEDVDLDKDGNGGDDDGESITRVVDDRVDVRVFEGVVVVCRRSTKKVACVNVQSSLRHLDLARLKVTVETVGKGLDSRRVRVYKGNGGLGGAPALAKTLQVYLQGWVVEHLDASDDSDSSPGVFALAADVSVYDPATDAAVCLFEAGTELPAHALLRACNAEPVQPHVSFSFWATFPAGGAVPIQRTPVDIGPCAYRGSCSFCVLVHCTSDGRLQCRAIRDPTLHCSASSSV